MNEKTVDHVTGKQKMQFWFPDSIKELLIKEFKRLDEEKTHLALIKFFGGCGTWWVSEYDPENEEFFGKAEIQEKELGYVSLKELRETRHDFGWIERDYYFNPTKLDQL